jgi:hypothetical protein
MLAKQNTMKHIRMMLRASLIIRRASTICVPLLQDAPDLVGPDIEHQLSLIHCDDGHQTCDVLHEAGLSVVLHNVPDPDLAIGIE